MVLDSGEIDALDEVRRETRAQLERDRIDNSMGARLSRLGRSLLGLVSHEAIAKPSESDIAEKRDWYQSEIMKCLEVLERLDDSTLAPSIVGQIREEFQQKAERLQLEFDSLPKIHASEPITDGARYKISHHIGGFAKLDIDDKHND